MAGLTFISIADLAVQTSGHKTLDAGLDIGVVVARIAYAAFGEGLAIGTVGEGAKSAGATR